MTNNLLAVATRRVCVVRKQVQRDYASALGVVAIVLGLSVICGITHTYMTRPALFLSRPPPSRCRMFVSYSRIRFVYSRESREPAHVTAQPERHQDRPNATDQPAASPSHHSR